MHQKESNFISAIVYLHNCEDAIKQCIMLVASVLEEKFAKYELILVNDACTDNTVTLAKQVAQECCHAPATLINMSLPQGIEMCMNAGIDLSIGDFVYEFDTTQIGYDKDLIFKAYETALTGYDIVSVSSPNVRTLKSKLFYKLFNSSIKSTNKLKTDVFRVLSRRAINRVHAISPSLPYRKAAYATSGLKITALIAYGFVPDKAETPHFSLALDALAMYTNAAYRLSLGISGLMLLATLLELAYTVYIYVQYIFFDGKDVVAGWTTTMLVISGGFFGVFLIFAIIIKYLSLLVELVFKQQKYLIEGIEKL